MFMTEVELKRLISDTHENDLFDYTETSVEAVLGAVGLWQDGWSRLYKRILARIKRKAGVRDYANTDGDYVSLPTDDNKNYMSVFFRQRSSGRFLVYDFTVKDKLTNSSIL